MADHAIAEYLKLGVTGLLAGGTMELIRFAKTVYSDKKEQANPKPPTNGKANKSDLLDLTKTVEAQGQAQKEQGRVQKANAKEIVKLGVTIEKVHVALVGDLDHGGYLADLKEVKRELKDQVAACARRNPSK